MVRGCALIDSRLDTAKICSDGRVHVDHAQLPAVFGGRKTFPHGLGKSGKTRCEHMFSALPLRADIAQRSRYVRFMPIAGITRLAPACRASPSKYGPMRRRPSRQRAAL